jgi:hypothetical protein
MRPPNWKEDEFRTLLAHLDLSNQAISGLIPRSVGAIGVVRSGVKEYHRGGNSGILSKMMRAILAAQ